MPKIEKQQLIHVVGGGFHQVPLVETAKAMGFRVLVTDMFPNPPARAVADEFEQIDITHKEDTLLCAKKFGIDYIVTDMTDVGVPTVAYVAENLGLPGIGYETALKFTNKHIMRKALSEEFAAHLPESRYFEKADDALRFYREFPHDYVVKPINSQGSRGVFLLTKEAADAEERVYAASTESQERGILLEDYISGNEYSAETFVRDGVVHNLTLTKKYHYAQSPCIDERNTYLGDVAPELERAIFALNERIIRALGLPFGNTHAEYMVQGEKIFLMEIAARSAGGSIGSKIIPYLTGFNCMEALLHALTGRSYEIKIEDYRKKFAVLKFYNFRPGRVKKIFINEGMLKGLLVFTLTDYLVEGAEVKPIRDSRDRLGYFVVHGTDREDVLRREKLAESAVKLEYEE
ncbi:MAG TPA: ATP-grasp domain-containing protein [bacterium]|nr:ATP-grasp domain-containing protein [bacterium]